MDLPKIRGLYKFPNASKTMPFPKSKILNAMTLFFQVPQKKELVGGFNPFEKYQSIVKLETFPK